MSIAIGQSSLVDDPSRSELQGRFDEAMRFEHEREHATEVSVSLEPEVPGDFERSERNADRLLAAIAEDSVDPYWAAARIAGLMVAHMPEHDTACRHYLMWVEMTDLVEAAEYDRTDAAVDLIRRAAAEWVACPTVARDEYFDRWDRTRRDWAESAQ